MVLLVYLLIFVLGIVIGSFLNVVIDRLPRGESLVKRRSHCEHCNKQLAWFDLIPLVSYILLHGRCRHCKKVISKYYITVEFLTGISFVLTIFTIIGQNIDLLAEGRFLITAGYILFVVSTLIAIFFIDYKYGIIPFKVVFAAVIVTCVWFFLLPFLHFTSRELGFLILEKNYFINYLASGLCAFAFFLFLFLITKGRGLGFGDVVYVFFMGFILGFPKVILALYIAFLTGAVGSLILVMIGRKKIRGGTIPFGPFLTFGTLISLLWGQFLLDKIWLFLLSR